MEVTKIIFSKVYDFWQFAIYKRGLYTDLKFLIAKSLDHGFPNSEGGGGTHLCCHLRFINAIYFIIFLLIFPKELFIVFS